MPSAENLKYICLRARQSDDHQIPSFAAKAADSLRFASIERIGRHSIAADLTARLNFDHASSQHSYIKQHTCPEGIISDTVMQNINRNVAQLKHYLVSIVKTDIRKNRKPAPAPLPDAMEQ